MSRVHLDMVGKTMGYLTVVRRVQDDKGKIWVARCVCGVEKQYRVQQLKQCRLPSCGCKRSETLSVTSRRHGGAYSLEYWPWCGVKARCLNKKSPLYPRYGARGVRLCKRWLKFENFLGDMGPRPSRAYSIDRINNNKGYYPSNCRWATSKEQARNRTCNHKIRLAGRTQTIAAWSEELGIKACTISQRIWNRGWTPQEALSIPVRRKGQ